MFDLLHLRYEIGFVDEALWGVSAGYDDLDLWGAIVQSVDDIFARKQSEIKGDGQFVENDYVVRSGTEQ